MFCHREGFFAGFRRENTVRLFFAFRKCNEHYRAGFRAIFDSDGTAVKRGNFPYERKPETHSAVLSAARLVNTEKRLENTLSVLFGDSVTVVPYAYLNVVFVADYRNVNYRIASGVTDGVFGEVKYHTVNQCIAADYECIAVVCKLYILFIGNRGEIGKNFICHGS